MERDELNCYITNNRLQIIAKPNAAHTEVLEWVGSRHALRVAIAAPPDKDKANGELVRYLTQLLGRKVKIVRGGSSRNKVVEIEKLAQNA